MKQYPRLSEVLSAVQSKTAGTIPDPGPDSSHPASVDDGNMNVNEGDTISDAKAKAIKAREDLAPESMSGAIEDKPALTLDNDVGKDASELPADASDYDSGVSDPGPDSSHPASTPSEKYAELKTVTDVLNHINTAIESLVAKVAAIPDSQVDKELGLKQAEAAKAQTSEKPAPSSEDETDKVAEILGELVPDELDADGVNRREKVANWVASELTPLIEDAYSRADNLAGFVKLAMQDPAAAEQMMTLSPEELAALEAESQGGMPGGPAPGGSEGGAGEEEMIMQAIMELSQELGKPPEEVVEMLLEEVSGGGAPGAPGAPEQPPVEALPEEKLAGSPESAKTAASPAVDKVTKTSLGDDKRVLLKKIANALLTETGKTPQEIAQGVC